MNVLLRNLSSTDPLNLDFTGSNVSPTLISIPPLSSSPVIANLTVLEFRQITSIENAISGGTLSISFSGGFTRLS